MVSESLARFLRNLSLDPSLLEAFEEDPEAVLADTDLSEEDKHLMRAADREQLRRRLPLAEPQPGGVLV